MKEHELYEFLKRLPKRIMANHTDLLTTDLPKFLGILGYEGSTIFFEFLLSLPHRVQADALVAEHRTGMPWIIVEVKTWQEMRDYPKEAWNAVQQSYRQFLAADDQWLLLFSPKVLGIASRSEAHLYDLVQLTEKESSEIYSLLRRPSKSSDEPSEQPPGVGAEAPL